MTTYSQAYIDSKTAGPFPGRIDPWAEAGRYFHQLHNEIISDMLDQLRGPLLAMGYIAGRETSLQIAENRQPDVYIQRTDAQTPREWDYAQAAEPGVLLEGSQPEWDAVFIKEAGTAQLVTAIEVISPRNKNDHVLIREYQERRQRLLTRAVNVVEVDLTRSVKRLIDDPLADATPYHIAVHLHNQPPRLISMEWGQPLKRFAVPLRAEVTPIDLQSAYDHAYKRTSLAWHIEAETGYTQNALTFPSLLTDDVIQALVQQVSEWKQRLRQLTT